MDKWKRRITILLLGLLFVFVASRPYWFFWKEGQWYVQPNSVRAKMADLEWIRAGDREPPVYSSLPEVKLRMLFGILDDRYIHNAFGSSYTAARPASNPDYMAVVTLPEDTRVKGYSWAGGVSSLHITGWTISGEIRFTTEEIYEGWQRQTENRFDDYSYGAWEIDEQTIVRFGSFGNSVVKERIIEKDDGTMHCWEEYRMHNGKIKEKPESVSIKYRNDSKGIYYGLNAMPWHVTKSPDIEWLKTIML